MLKNPLRVSKVTLFVAGLIIIVLFHRSWFSSDNVLTGGDWGYGTSEWILEYLNPFFIWKSDADIGSYNTAFNYNAVFFFQALLIKLGASYELSQRIEIFWPVAFLPFVAVFLIFNYLYQSPKHALLAGLYATLAPRILMSKSGHLHLVMVYTLSLLSFYFILRGVRERSRLFILISSLLMSFGFFFEPRVGYIALASNSGYLIFNMLFAGKGSEFKANLISLLTYIFVIVSVNAFWLTPYFIGGGSADVFSQAASKPWVSRDRVIHGLLQTHPDWTGGAPSIFQDHLPGFSFVIFPLVVYSNLLFRRVSRETLFFILVAIAGTFLLKEENRPLGGVYTWLFFNFPLFSAFRESSKFNILITFSYSLLFPLGLMRLSDKLAPINHNFSKFSKYMWFFGLLFILFIARPAVLGRMSFAFVGAEFPKSYESFKQVLLNSKEFHARQLWIPDKSRFAHFSSLLPITAYSGIQMFDSYKQEKSFPGYLKNAFFYDVLEMAGFKYIVVAQESVVFENYKHVRFLKALIENFQVNHSFSRVYEYGDFSVFESESNSIFPKIYLSQSLLNYSGPYNGLTYLAELDEELPYYSTVIINDESPPSSDLVVVAPEPRASYENILGTMTLEKVSIPTKDMQFGIPASGFYRIAARPEERGELPRIIDSENNLVEWKKEEGRFKNYDLLGTVYLEKGKYYLSIGGYHTDRLVNINEFEVRNMDVQSSLIDRENGKGMLLLIEDTQKLSSLDYKVSGLDPLSSYTISFESTLRGGEPVTVEVTSRDTYKVPEKKIVKNLIPSKSVWNHYKLDFTPQSLSTEAVLSFKFNKKGNTSKNGNQFDDIAFGISNISIKKKPTVPLLFIKGELEAVRPNTSLSFQRINPSLYRINISREGNSNQKFFLNFSERYNDGWQLNTIENARFTGPMHHYPGFNVTEFVPLNKVDLTTGVDSILQRKHFANFGLFNAWPLEKGEYFEIEFTPQRQAYIGWFISICSFLCIIVVAAVVKIYDIKKKHT